jgi:hypothetical protein
MDMNLITPFWKVSMKKLFFLILTGVIASCSTMRKSSSLPGEGELIITRKFIGVLIDYRQTGPENYDGPNIIWLKTSMESIYGRLSAYGKKCEFSPGERLYLRRTYYSPGLVSGYWVYTVENDSSISYRATDFQHDKGVLIRTWFE